MAAKKDIKRRGPAEKAVLAFLLALCGLAVYAYAGLSGAPFIFDDIHTIRDNQALRESVSPLYFLAHPETASAIPSTLMRPLLTWSYALNYRAAGEDPDAFRLVNFVLHALNALLVMLLARRAPRLRPYAIWAGVLFLAHPLLSIQVGYVSCRSVLLSSSFYLGAMVVFSRGLTLAGGGNGVASEETDAVGGGLLDRFGPAGTVAIVSVLYGLGLLAKSVAATLPAALLLWHFFFAGGEDNGGGGALARLLPGRGARRRLTLSAAAATLVVFGAYLLYRRAFSAPTFFPESRPWPAWQYAASQAVIVWKYFGLLLWPVNLAVERPAWMPASASDLCSLGFIAAILGLLALSGAAVFLRRAAPEAGFSILFGLLYLLPTSSIVPLVVPANENRPYLTAVAAVFGLLALRALWPRRYWRADVPLAAIALLFVLLLQGRADVYVSETRLWREAASAAPGSSRPWVNLGALYSSYGRIDDAERLYRMALGADPDNARALVNLGNIEFRRGKEDEAILLYEAALRASPLDPVAPLRLGEALIGKGDMERARTVLESAAGQQPDNAALLVALAKWHIGAGGVPEPASELLKRALSVSRDPKVRREAALLLRSLGG